MLNDTTATQQGKIEALESDLRASEERLRTAENENSVLRSQLQEQKATRSKICLIASSVGIEQLTKDLASLTLPIAKARGFTTHCIMIRQHGLIMRPLIGFADCLIVP